MTVSAFGVEHELAKHVFGRHDENTGHSRSDHPQLRREKRAAKRSYRRAANDAYSQAHATHRKAHPWEAVFDDVGAHAASRSGTSYTSGAERAGQKAHREFGDTEAGQRGQREIERTRGNYNPRYAARRKAQRKADFALAKSAFGIEHEVSKVSPALKVVGAGAGLVGAQAGVNEGLRRHYNKKGANVSVRQQYVHPYLAQYQMNAAAARSKAEKVQDKADRTGSPRLERKANRLRGISSNFNEASQTGALRARHEGRILVGRKGLDAQRNKAPQTIGKSAFGIEHP